MPDTIYFRTSAERTVQRYFHAPDVLHSVLCYVLIRIQLNNKAERNSLRAVPFLLSPLSVPYGILVADGKFPCSLEIFRIHIPFHICRKGIHQPQYGRSGPLYDKRPDNSTVYADCNILHLVLYSDIYRKQGYKDPSVRIPKPDIPYVSGSLVLTGVILI